MVICLTLCRRQVFFKMKGIDRERWAVSIADNQRFRSVCFGKTETVSVSGDETWIQLCLIQTDCMHLD